MHLKDDRLTFGKKGAYCVLEYQINLVGLRVTLGLSLSATLFSLSWSNSTHPRALNRFRVLRRCHSLLAGQESVLAGSSRKLTLRVSSSGGKGGCVT